MRHQRLWLAAAAAMAVFACGAPAQPPAESTPAALEGQGWTGLTEPDEVIEARRVLMQELERLMRPLDSFIAGEPGDLDAMRSAAQTMEAMLLAFPHLFPPTTNAYDPTVLEPPTVTLPVLWENFDAFLGLAGTAEEAVAAVRAATTEEQMLSAARALRGSCDACHAAFTKPYTPPKVTDEDLDFDFDSFLPQ